MLLRNSTSVAIVSINIRLSIHFRQLAQIRELDTRRIWRFWSFLDFGREIQHGTQTFFARFILAHHLDREVHSFPSFPWSTAGWPYNYKLW